MKWLKTCLKEMVIVKIQIENFHIYQYNLYRDENEVCQILGAGKLSDNREVRTESSKRNRTIKIFARMNSTIRKPPKGGDEQ